MNTQLLIDFLSRLTHVSTVIALIGGTMFMLFVLIPSAEQLSPAEHEKLRGAHQQSMEAIHPFGNRAFFGDRFLQLFSRYGESQRGRSLSCLDRHQDHPGALVIFFIASALVGRSAKLEFIRTSRVYWLRVIVMLAAVVVGFSSFIKFLRYTG